MNISKKALDLIIDFETGGEAYYKKVYKSAPVWPGFSSGVTIFFGTDLGYIDKQEFDSKIAKYFSKEDAAKLRATVGVKGSAAKSLMSSVRGIKCSWEDGEELFVNHTLPKFMNLTKKTFPGVENLHPNAQGAILSIVFNRGTSLSGSRRVEMLNLRRIIPTKNYKAMAAEVRKMKRLWPNNKNSNSDLFDRREAEARLIESEE
jgi:hypothetical protein